MRLFLFSVIYVVLSLECSSQSFPKMRTEDRMRIHEAEFLLKKFGNQVWPGLARVPFTVLMVYDTSEFLINCLKPPAEFRNSGFDTILSTQVYTRRSVHPDNLLATFPAVNGQICIVVGTPERTGLSSTAWVITLLHEHFHHYTYMDPNYYKEVNKLKLSRGDSSGMWMLNYTFPYDDETVIKHYTWFSKTLHDALKGLDSDNFELFLQTYARARIAFKKGLKPDDYKYFSFQVWQEGVAKYIEFKFLETMGKYKPTSEIQQLPDYIPYDEYREQMYKEELDNLTAFKLAEQKRTCFYTIGFAEATILDYLNPKWKKLYLKNKFYMEKY
jgi:hypothetical protein